jgi:hypothetical protein
MCHVTCGEFSDEGCQPTREEFRGTIRAVPSGACPVLGIRGTAPGSRIRTRAMLLDEGPCAIPFVFFIECY